MASSFDLKSQAQKLVSQELGGIRKAAARRVALVYPSPYRIAMSSLGYQSIYRRLNRLDDVSCERSFLPDNVDDYVESRTPLFTYETETPVADFDLIGFSVSYETEVLGLLQCLELAGIPLRSSERDSAWPIVIAGGPLTFSNPLPLSPFIDLIVMGEAEDVLDALIRLWRDSGGRDAFLSAAAQIPGVYVPDEHGERLLPIAQCRDTELPAYAPIITANTELSSMHLVENARGCHRGCTFCVMRRTTNAGMRVVSPQRVLETIPDHARRVGLVGAATTDHPQIREILRSIVDGGREVGLSSLRADRLDDEFVGLLARGGARTLTVAADGSSEAMRRQAKKGIKAKHLVRAAELVRDHELRLLKIYVVLGYPGERAEDVAELVELVKELSSICDVAVGVSPLVPKKNTPLDGLEFGPRADMERLLKQFQDGVGRVADVRSTSVRWAWLEWRISQGGWSVGEAALQAFRDGGSFGAWKRALKDHDTGSIATRRPVDERIRPGVFVDS